jgi:putative sterol carrier protein
MFPSQEWVQEIYEKLNSDECYAQIARNWEGDMRFVIEPSGPLTETVNIYLDLWHGKCRLAVYEDPNPQNSPAFILKAPYENFSRVINGELEPMQALLTRKLSVHGNMAVLMRNIPTVLDFVRCCREITDRVL